MVEIGDILYGFCNGFFGRDSYDPKTVEAVGDDWVVVRENDRPLFASFEGEWRNQMEELLNKWKVVLCE